MKNPRLAHRYAKSLVDLAVEQNQLEVVYTDMKFIQTVCNTSKDFLALLRSPIIQATKKVAIIEAVLGSKVSQLTSLFLKLLVNKGREGDTASIAEAVIEQYNTIKGISQVKLTTAVEVSNEVKNAIVAKLKAENGFGNVELQTAVNEKLIGGFVLEFNNNLVDASIARDLRDIKNQFGKNFFVPNMH